MNIRLQRGFRAIMHNFRIDLAMTLKDVKDNGFPISSSAPFLLHPLRAKEFFVDFYRACKGRKLYILLRDAGLDIRLQEYAHDEHTDFPIMLYMALGVRAKNFKPQFFFPIW